MPEATFIQDGRTLDYTAGGAIAIGAVVVQGDLVGVIVGIQGGGATGVSGDLCSLATEGVFEFAKPTGAGTDSVAGTLYYWDDTNNVATEDAASGANKLLGVSVAAVTTAGTTVRVMLRQR